MVVVDFERRGFTRTVNQGIAAAYDGHIVLLNDDCVMSQDWLAVMMLNLHKYAPLDVGFVGPSGACRTWPQNTGRRGDQRKPRTVGHVAGFCLLIREDCVALLDERFAHYGSDVYLQRSSPATSLWVPGVYCDHGLHEPHEPWWTEDNELLRRLLL